MIGTNGRSVLLAHRFRPSLNKLTNFRLETDADGIATATWDMPGRSMNVIDLAVVDELATLTPAWISSLVIGHSSSVIGGSALRRAVQPDQAPEADDDGQGSTSYNP